jgi:hypothetical protein
MVGVHQVDAEGNEMLGGCALAAADTAREA